MVPPDLGNISQSQRQTYYSYQGTSNSDKISRPWKYLFISSESNTAASKIIIRQACLIWVGVGR